jgi:hypothetical protein
MLVNKNPVSWMSKRMIGTAEVDSSKLLYTTKKEQLVYSGFEGTPPILVAPDLEQEPSSKRRGTPQNYITTLIDTGNLNDGSISDREVH